MSAEATGRLTASLRTTVGTLHLEADFHPQRGTAAIVGPSGSGKSTLLRALAGLERGVDGRIVVDGETWLDTAAGVRVPAWERSVGWVPQDALLFPHLSVERNLGYAGATATRVREEAARFEIGHLLDRAPRNLSGGERQRVALVRALLRDPGLLLLDEPFSALDRPLRRTLAARLREWIEHRRVPTVLVTHDEEDVRLLDAERWALADGRLSAQPEG